MEVINIHTHIFIDKNVPEKFLPLKLVRFLIKYRFTKRFARFLNSLNPFNSDDTFDRYANFITLNSKSTSEEIFLNLKNYYPTGSSFVTLSMDFEYMQAGNCPQGFLMQLNDLHLLKQKYGNQIYPFMAIDPRRPNLLELVKDFIENKGGTGLKLYPPLGYYPFDQRLYPIYEYAQKNNIPIITHCSRGGTYYRGKLTENDLVHPKTGERFSKEKNKIFIRNWSNPKNYYYVLNDFPELRLNLGHFGGIDDWADYLRDENRNYDESWIEIILDLISKYPNVYTDISYTLFDKKYFNTLKNFLTNNIYKNKILFGSDYYMDEIEVNETHFSTFLRDELGDEFYLQMAVKNNKKFLNTI